MIAETIRDDFPVLAQGLIYLDSSATSLTPKLILNKLIEYYTYYRANPSRSIHSFARRAEDKLREARVKSARFINASPEEIIFTRNTTEGLNIVARGIRFDEGGGNIVVTALEHHSNFLPWMEKCKREGREFRVVYPKKGESTILEDDFLRYIDRETRLVALAHVSNVLGTILPVREVSKIAHENGAYVVLDAAQSAPHMRIDVEELNVDFLALSGHKICGPTGSGLLYMRKDLMERVDPLYLGGGTVLSVQPSSYELLTPPAKYEAGTVAHCEAMAMVDAFEYVSKIGLDDILDHDRHLIRLAHELLENVDGVKIYSPTAEKGTSIFAFAIENLDPTEVAMILDSSSNIAVRSGHLCAQICTKEVLSEPEGVVRASTYIYNTEKEIKMFAEAVKDIVDAMVT
ncbi:MAG: aminotransferase class V-fold PLP-dependent enzyme [Nitrososphaeria archaeon]